MSAALPALARPPFMRGGAASGGGAGVPAYTLTFANTSGSAAPTDIPIQAAQWFGPGDVPSGYIAVPQSGGVDLIYQADNRVYNGDGSLRGAVFRIAWNSGLAGSGTLQITWVIRAGSYSNTSAITTATVTSETDYRISMTKTHTAYCKPNGGAGQTRMDGQVVALTVNNATGEISGGRVAWPTTLTRTVANVGDGGGTGGQISTTSGTVNVITPGSGYGYVGSGSFETALNTVIGLINSNGNRANGRRIEQYAKGPVCDGWWVVTTVPGLNHKQHHFFFERWKKSDGSLLGYKLMPVLAIGLVDLVNSMPSYTYDLDIKDGATVIRGSTNGDAGYTTLLHFIGSAFPAADSNGDPYWSVNSTSYNAIIPQRTQQECKVLRYTGVITPPMALTPTVTVPTVTTAYTFPEANGGLTNKGTFVPLGNHGIRSAIGNGGSGWDEGPMSGLDMIYYLALYNSQTANARVWYKNIKIGACNSPSYGQLGSPILEPTTMYLPNPVPTSAQTFTGMTPTRQSVYVGDITTTGSGNSIIGGYDELLRTSFGDPYHQVCLTYGYYVHSGEQWIANSLMYAALSTKFGRFHGSTRQATIGSTTYYGINGNTEFNERVSGWMGRTEQYALAIRPPLWADGSADRERELLDYTLGNTYTYLNDLVPFLGTVQFGTSGTPATKSTDFTNSGIWPEDFNSVASSNTSEALVEFMYSYTLMTLSHGAFLLQGTATGTAMATWLRHHKIALIRLFQDTGASHYLKMPYRLGVQTATPPSGPADISYGAVNPANAPNSLSVLAYGFGGVVATAVTVTFNASSATHTLNHEIKFIDYPSAIRAAEGTRVRFTIPFSPSYPNGAPSPFNNTTYYYLHYPNSGAGDYTTVQFCTGVDGGGNPDPATAVICGGTGRSGVCFFMIPTNAQPTDASGAGTYEAGGVSIDPVGRICQFLGTIRLMRALGIVDETISGQPTNISAAETTLQGMFTATGQSYVGMPTYAFDSTRAIV